MHASMSIWSNAERLLPLDETQAGILYRQLVDDALFAVPARLRLSLIAERRGDYREAVSRIASAAKVSTSDADVIAMLCKRLFTLGEIETSIELASGPWLIQSTSISAVAEVGKLMTDAFCPDVALRLLRRALELGLDSPGLHYLIGLSLMYCGRLDDAGREFEHCLQSEPDFARTHWAVSKLRRWSPGEHNVDRIRASIARLGAASRERPLLLYALHKELDDLGDVAGAWKALESGMHARRSQVTYDAAEERALFTTLRSFTPVVGTGVDDPSTVPIFIVGLPRSGTTLLERVLANHPDVSAGGELHDFILQLRWMCNRIGKPYLDLDLATRAQEGSIDWTTLGERYLSHTRFRAHGCSHFTDKMPANFVNIGYILSALPNARILHMVRNGMDTCFSNLKELFAGAYPHTYDQLEMADHYLAYRQLMAHWHQVAPGRILDISYEALVRQPEETAAAVLAHCGLTPVESMARIEDRGGVVSTASSVQVREPIHTRHVMQWQRYSDYLQPLQEHLMPEASGSLASSR